MQKHLLFGIGGLIIGLAIGFFAANSLNRSAGLQSAALQTQPVNPVSNQTSAQNPPSAMMPDVTETLEKAKGEPQNFDAQMKAGDMYAQIGRFEKALEFYEQAAKIKPNDFQTLVKTGNAFFDAGEYEKAEGFYAKALEIKEDLNVRTDLGITFVERQNPDIDRAIKEFETSLESNPSHEATLYNLAVAYAKKGDSDNAAKFKARLKESNPQSDLVERLDKIFAAN